MQVPSHDPHISIFFLLDYDCVSGNVLVLRREKLSRAF